MDCIGFLYDHVIDPTGHAGCSAARLRLVKLEAETLNSLAALLVAGHIRSN